MRQIIRIACHDCCKTATIAEMRRGNETRLALPDGWIPRAIPQGKAFDLYFECPEHAGRIEIKKYNKQGNEITK